MSAGVNFTSVLFRAAKRHRMSRHRPTASAIYGSATSSERCARGIPTLIVLSLNVSPEVVGDLLRW